MSFQAHRFKKSWRGLHLVEVRPETRKERESLHHRKPRSLGGTDEVRNLIRLPISRHQAWHTLFQNWTPERIAQEINKRYGDPDYEFLAVKKS